MLADAKRLDDSNSRMAIVNGTLSVCAHMPRTDVLPPHSAFHFEKHIETMTLDNIVAPRPWPPMTCQQGGIATGGLSTWFGRRQGDRYKEVAFVIFRDNSAVGTGKLLEEKLEGGDQGMGDASATVVERRDLALRRDSVDAFLQRIRDGASQVEIACI